MFNMLFECRNATFSDMSYMLFLHTLQVVVPFAPSHNVREIYTKPSRKL